VVDARQGAVLVGDGQSTPREPEAKRAMSPPELMAQVHPASPAARPGGGAESPSEIRQNPPALPGATHG